MAQAGGKTVEWGEIVGVVGDVESVNADPTTATSYQVYEPIAQAPRRMTEIAVRTSGAAPSTLVDGIRATMMSLDPDLPVRKLQSARTTIARANTGEAMLGTVLAALAVLGLGLASLGVYGVIARTVAQRTGEFGIRLALGAQAGDITRLVLASGAKLAVLGAAVGLVGAVGISRLLAASFSGMHTTPGPVLIAATVLLIAVAQVAGYIPARHASRISPTEALRIE
jgi:putative ABC transport system permease protein